MNDIVPLYSNAGVATNERRSGAPDQEDAAFKYESTDEDVLIMVVWVLP